MKRDDIVTDPAAAVQAQRRDLAKHKESLVKLHLHVEEATAEIARAQEVVNAANASSEPLRALEQERRQLRATAFAGLTTFDSSEIDRRIHAAQQAKDKVADKAAAAADALTLLLIPAREEARLAEAAEAKRGAELRYELLHAVIYMELDRHRETFKSHVEAHARLAGALLAADRFSDPQNGRPRVNTIPHQIALRPHVPEIAVPGLDPARAAALASWDFACGPSTAQALTEFLRMVE